MTRLIALVIMVSSISSIALSQQFYLKIESTGRTFGPFEFEDGATIQLGGNMFTLQIPATETKARSEIKATVEPEMSLASHTVLRQWKPNDHPKGYGAEILLTEDLSEADLIAFIKKLSKGHDPVNIRIFSSPAAYEAEKNDDFGEVYARGYILFYVKNLTGKGAYRGLNEIRWMQEEGKFSSKFGTKTKL